VTEYAVDVNVRLDTVLEAGPGPVASPEWAAFVASQGTIFHTGHFLLPWWHDRLAGHPSSRLVTARVLDGGRLIGVCVFELSDGVLSFAGGADVVDYMGPVALAGRETEVAQALALCMFEDLGMFEDLAWDRARLAGLVHDDPTASAFIDAVRRLAPCAVAQPYDRAPRIDRAPDGYLALLNSKRRADVLRKRNRLAEAVGELELVVSTSADVADRVERLLAWKADAGPETREFVALYGRFVRTLVGTLAAVDAAHVVELHAGGRPLASVIVLSHRDTTYIYNMAYDQNLAAEDGHAGLAPGVVLVSLLVERTLDRGLRFDFLKGAQDYKLRLGGNPVDLIGITLER
jgi:CelD/BcsL family acetyltransferase involved in cellulose biosynthesis